MMIEPTKLPRHVAIIMDGNGRWAAARGVPHVLGHRAGADAVRQIVEASCEFGLAYLTLYAFSWENWNRPESEIRDLMALLDDFLAREAETLHKQRVRLQALGRLEQLPDGVARHLQRMIRDTASYDRLTLTLALSYGGRQEIVDAAKRLARRVQQGELSLEAIDDMTFARALYLPDLPDPDLLIRTSGEQRISNFLLWQISYCELYVTPTLWPDFTKDDLAEALAAYQSRERRFGKSHATR